MGPEILGFGRLLNGWSKALRHIMLDWLQVFLDTIGTYFGLWALGIFNLDSV